MTAITQEVAAQIKVEIQYMRPSRLIGVAMFDRLPSSAMKSNERQA